MTDAATRLPVQHPDAPHCKRNLPTFDDIALVLPAGDDGYELLGSTIFLHIRCKCGARWDRTSSLNAIKLSERAGLILQGFPDGWHVAGKTKRSRWSQIGQAMPPPLAHAVATSIARWFATQAVVAKVEQVPA